MPRSPLVALLSLVLVAGCSGSGAHASADNTPPAPSPVGRADGDPVTKSVGAAGGNVTSADGRFSVGIPAGALAGDTPIGIQPITNTTAPGLGAAYRLTPAGQTFSKPVTLTFPYTDADLEGTYAEALGIAYQDADGRWEWQDATVLDTAAKTLTVTSIHFSDWSKVPGVQLRPPNATVKPNGKVTLTVMNCLKVGNKVTYVRFRCGDPADDLVSLVAVVPGTWAVDGAPGGTTGHGLVTGGKTSGVYTAPAKKFTSRGPSIVAVSVTVRHTNRTTQIASSITILGGYSVVGKFSEVNSPLVCAGTVSAKVTDMVTLDLVLTGDNRYTVTNLKNFDTKYVPPRVPVIGLGALVKSKPDVFKATKGEANLLSDSDLVSVALDGKLIIGVCNLGIPVDTTGETSDDTLGVSFHTTSFFDSGVQRNLPSDIGRPGWLWTITEN